MILSIILFHVMFMVLVRRRLIHVMCRVRFLRLLSVRIMRRLRIILMRILYSFEIICIVRCIILIISCILIRWGRLRRLLCLRLISIIIVLLFLRFRIRLLVFAFFVYYYY